MRKRFVGIGKTQLSELKSVEKTNNHLKKIVADLELDKLIFNEGLELLKQEPDGHEFHRPPNATSRNRRRFHTSITRKWTAFLNSSAPTVR